MKWEEARSMYVSKWILFEAIEAYPKEGKRIVEELSVINAYEAGNEALKEYAEKHKRDKSREMYVYHTKHEKLFIEERTWIGVRKND